MNGPEIGLALWIIGIAPALMFTKKLKSREGWESMNYGGAVVISVMWPIMLVASPLFLLACFGQKYWEKP